MVLEKMVGVKAGSTLRIDGKCDLASLSDWPKNPGLLLTECMNMAFYKNS